MKRLLALLVLLSLAVASLTANGQQESVQEDGTMVLEFPTWQAEEGGFAAFWHEMIEKFEQENPGTEINITQIPFGQYHDTLTTRFTVNNPPDIVHIASKFFNQFASQGWFTSLDQNIDGAGLKGNWTPLQSSMEYMNEQQGLLVMGYGFVLYYNEKILNEAGVAVPQTKKELLAAIEKIESLGKADLHAYGMTTQQHSNVYQDFCNFVYGQGNTLIKDGSFNLKDKKVIAAADEYRRAAEYAPKGVSIEMLRQLFIDGKIGMIIDGPWVASMLKDAPAEIQDSLKMARPPFDKVPGSISNSLHIAEKTSPEKQKAVWDFIELISRPENQVRYTELTNSPAGRTGISETLDSPALKLVNDLASEAVSILPESENLMKNYSRYVNVCVDAILSMQIGDEPTADILAELESELINQGLEP